MQLEKGNDCLGGAATEAAFGADAEVLQVLFSRRDAPLLLGILRQILWKFGRR